MTGATEASGRASRTRERILDVALDLFRTRGYDQATLADIAERMGFTKAALYYHFKAKDAILLELLAPLIADLEALADADVEASTPDALRHALGRYLDVLIAHADLVGLLQSDRSTIANPAIQRGLGSVIHFRERLAGREGAATAELAVACALGVVAGAIDAVGSVAEHRESILDAAVGAYEAVAR